MQNVKLPTKKYFETVSIPYTKIGKCEVIRNKCCIPFYLPIFTRSETLSRVQIKPAVTPQFSMTKSELRKIYLARQRSLSAAERKEKSRLIAASLFGRFDLSRLKFLHVFLPIEKNNEIKTAFIYERVWRDFPEITTVVPKVDFETMTLENRRFSFDTELIKNRWNILEPAASEIVEIERLDAVLVPLLCFDERGLRAGYGKGFYDKFLSECRADCLKIGLSYFPPTAKISDAQTFDIRLNFCIAPHNIFKFKDKKS